MMGFKEFAEREKRDSAAVENIISILKDNVESEYIRTVLKYGWIYRGINIKSVESVVMRRSSKTDRKPKDTPKKIHDVLDELFLKHFGWKARSEGVFTTGSYPDAHGYGRTYIFFPIGDYKFVFSSSIEDAFNEFSNIEQMYKKSVSSVPLEDYFKDKFRIETYQDDDLVKGIKSKNEIIFKCKEYFLIDERFGQLLKGLNGKLS